MAQTTGRIATLVTLVLFFSACSKKPAQISPTPEQTQAFALMEPTPGTVNVTVTKDGNAYEIRVDPWKVKPPANKYFNKITWHFKAEGGINFTQVSLNCKTHKNFQNMQAAGPNWVLEGQVTNPVPNAQIEGIVDNPSNKLGDYTYIVNLDIKIDEETFQHIEIDPDYRVWP